MTTTRRTEKKKAAKRGHVFTKQGKVSIWASEHPYEDIPDEYFEENFFRNKTRATNTWSDNFNLQYFCPETMETNGAQTGTVAIKKAAGECSYSSSFIDGLMSKAKKKKMEKVTWIILLYELEYSPRVSGVDKDNFTTFLGAFDYDDSADNFHA